MNRRALGLLVVLMVISLPARGDFASIARSIDAQKGVKRIWIPFLGLARTMVRMVEPHGVSDFQLVTFKGADALDPRQLHDLMRREAGPGFRPLVEARSQRKGEWSFIYARPHRNGEQVELLILAHEDDEDTVLIRVDVDPEVLARGMDEPVRMGRR